MERVCPEPAAAEATRRSETVLVDGQPPPANLVRRLAREGLCTDAAPPVLTEFGVDVLQLCHALADPPQPSEAPPGKPAGHVVDVHPRRVAPTAHGGARTPGPSGCGAPAAPSVAACRGRRYGAGPDRPAAGRGALRVPAVSDHDLGQVLQPAGRPHPGVGKPPAGRGGSAGPPRLPAPAARALSGVPCCACGRYQSGVGLGAGRHQKGPNRVLRAINSCLRGPQLFRIVGHGWALLSVSWKFRVRQGAAPETDPAASGLVDPLFLSSGNGRGDRVCGGEFTRGEPGRPSSVLTKSHRRGFLGRRELLPRRAGDGADRVVLGISAQRRAVGARFGAGEMVVCARPEAWSAPRAIVALPGHPGQGTAPQGWVDW